MKHYFADDPPTIAEREARMKAMLIQQAEALDAIESVMMVNPARMGQLITEAQDKLSKFIREEFQS